MKLTKKKIFVTALVVCLVAIISLGSLAWFQATDEVTNRFTVSTEDTNQRPDFALDLYEHNILANGTLGTEEVETNTYTHIAPGANLQKDPTVRNAGQYDMWVRIKVTLTDYSAWEAVLGNDYDFSAILAGVNADWTLDSTTVGTDTLVYYKNTELVAGAESTLFEGVVVPGAFTVDNIPVEFSLNLVAEAIQSDNTGTNPQEAFNNYWN